MSKQPVPSTWSALADLCGAAYEGALGQVLARLSRRFAEPSPIQARLMPALSPVFASAERTSGVVVARAATGSGKTVAFMAPCLAATAARLGQNQGRPRHPRQSGKDQGRPARLASWDREAGRDPRKAWELVIAPSAVLARQIFAVSHQVASRDVARRVALVVNPDDASLFLTRKARLVVATPRGALAIFQRYPSAHRQVARVVVDEADAVLRPMSRYAPVSRRRAHAKRPPSTTRVIETCLAPHRRKPTPAPQLVLVSATASSALVSEVYRNGWLDRGAALARVYEERSRVTLPPQLVHEAVHCSGSPRDQVLAVLLGIIRSRGSDVDAKVLIVVEHGDADAMACAVAAAKRVGEGTRLVTTVLNAGVPSPVLAASDVVIATRSSLRGLDLPPHFSSVVLLAPPSTANAYLHAAGRTARGGAPGTAWTLVTNATEKLDLDRLGAHLGITFGPGVSLA